MLQPSQFQVNEAWIVFKLNDAPIRTERDGGFDFIGLMDAASCFIVSSAPVPDSERQPSKLQAKRLLKEGRTHKQELPKTLFIPTGLCPDLLALEAEHQGITVVRVQEDQLLVFISEAREGFRERFGGGGTR